MFAKLKKQFSLENYFLLAIFLLPAYLLRFSIFGLPTNLWEALAIVAIVLAVWEIKKDSITFSGYEKKIAVLFLVIIIGLVLGMIKSGNYSVGLGIIKSWFLVPFAFAFLANRVIANKKMAWESLYLSTFVVAVVAIIYKISGAVTFDGRLQAFFNSPNYLAMYLAPGIIISFLKPGFRKSQDFKNLKLLKLLQFFMIVILLLALFFTYSYSAWASILITVSIIFLLNHKFSKRYLSILILIFGVLLFILKNTAKFHDLVNYNSRSSLASRIMIWNSAGKILGDNYILGIGPGNFQDKYLEYQKYFPPYLEWAVPHPHNLYLAFWLNTGIIGLFSFLAILYLFFKRTISDPGFNNITNIISLGVIIYFLLHGLVDTTYFKNDLAVIFWLAILFI